MKRSLSPLILAAAGAAAGCVSNDQSLSVSGFAPITAVSGDCIAVPGTTFLSRGTYDVLVPIIGAPAGYWLAPMVQNNVAASGTSASIERNAVTITGFDIELRDRSGHLLKGTSPTKTLPVTARIQPGGSIAMPTETFSREVAETKLLPLFLSRSWDGLLIIHLRPFGTLSAGPITGEWVDFTVNFCDGCLVGPLDPEADPPALAICPQGGLPATQIQKGGACFPSQDVPITCCKEGQTAVCGDRIETETAGSADAGA